MKHLLFKLRFELLLVAFASFIFNWQFVLVRTFADTPRREWDTTGLINGFYQHPAFLGGWDAWRGPWMYEGAKSQFRPIASHFHWLQIWVGENISWHLVGWMTWAVFAIICLAATLISYRWTGSRWLAAIAGVAVARVAAINPGHPVGWLAWFPVADFLLSIAFLMLAILSFDTWLRNPDRKYLIATWCCFLAAALSKELSYIFPLMAVAMAALHPDRAPIGWKRLALVPALLSAGTIALTIYRRAVLPKPGMHSMSFGEIYKWAIERNELMFAWRAEQWALLGFCAVIGGTALWFYKQPTKRTAAIGLSAIVAYIVATLGFDPGFSFTFIENPVRTLWTAVNLLFVPLGVGLILKQNRRDYGLMTLAIYGLIHVPLLDFLHNQLFHYTITPVLFLPVHLSVVAAMVYREVTGKSKQAVGAPVDEERNQIQLQKMVAAN